MAGVADPRAAAAPGLVGRTIVVTRPERQADTLARRIREAGGTPVLFPVLEILDVEDPRSLIAVVADLARFDIAVFVSPNAVERAMNLIFVHGGFPSALRAATVGKGSSDALRRLGIADVIAPSHRFDSEALLDVPEMKSVAGKRIVIFRGDGGRETLGETLAARGARVEYAACYRRSKPSADPAPLFRLWARKELSGIVVTSSEGLHNLFEIVGPCGRQLLEETLVFVPHPRIAETARALGSRRVVLTGPNDEGVLKGMIDWWSEGSHPRTPT